MSRLCTTFFLFFLVFLCVMPQTAIYTFVSFVFVICFHLWCVLMVFSFNFFSQIYQFALSCLLSVLAVFISFVVEQALSFYCKYKVQILSDPSVIFCIFCISVFHENASTFSTSKTTFLFGWPVSPSSVFFPNSTFQVMLDVGIECCKDDIFLLAKPNVSITMVSSTKSK